MCVWCVWFWGKAVCVCVCGDGGLGVMLCVCVWFGGNAVCVCVHFPYYREAGSGWQVRVCLCVCCDGPAGEQCPTWLSAAKRRRLRGMVLEGRYYPRSFSWGTPPHPGVSGCTSQVHKINQAIRSLFKLNQRITEAR